MISSIHEAVAFAESYGLKRCGKYADEGGTMAYWAKDRDTNREYVIVFKRDWLHKFSGFFPQCPEKGWGQSLNCDLLEEAVARNAVVMVVMPKEAAYVVDAAAWKSYAVKYNSIRTPSTETSKEASIPARMLVRAD